MGIMCLKQKEPEKEPSIKDTIEFNQFDLIEKDYDKILKYKINSDEEGTKIFWREKKNYLDIPIKNDYENSYYINDDVKTNYNILIGHDAVLNDSNKYLNNKEVIKEINKLFEAIEDNEKKNKNNIEENKEDIFKIKELNLNEEDKEKKNEYLKIKTASDLCLDVNLFHNDKQKKKNNSNKKSIILDMSTLKKMIRKNNISANTNGLKNNIIESKDKMKSKIIGPIKENKG